MLASVIIRTYNEEKYLGELLRKIQEQNTEALTGVEVIVVDSGSTDQTVDIAKRYGARVVTINKSEFSFGRSLNIGCRVASGEFLVFISGHCVPCDEFWLRALLAPLIEKPEVVYSYGRQVGGSDTRFSEHQIFSKYFPAVSQIPQSGYYCNNANAALRKVKWVDVPFDEDITGLEDMHLARQLVARGHKVAYVAQASVYHHHMESWFSVRRRYEREAIALQSIMPEIQISIFDAFRFFCIAVLVDIAAALEQRRLWNVLRGIFIFRLMQFWGAYKGNHEHRKSSKQMKEIYFYPRRFE